MKRKVSAILRRHSSKALSYLPNRLVTALNTYLDLSLPQDKLDSAIARNPGFTGMAEAFTVLIRDILQVETAPNLSTVNENCTIHKTKTGFDLLGLKPPSLPPTININIMAPI